MNEDEKSGSLRRGDRVKVSFSSMAPGGEAVSKDIGIALFVDRAAPNDVAEVELVSVKKDYARGRLVSIVEASPERIEPPCKLFKVCGGCQWQHLAYQSQLDHKTSIVKQAVQRLGGLDPAIVKPCLGADEPLHYRNKVQFPVRNPKGSSRILAGYYKPDSHELVNIKHCPVQSSSLDAMLDLVKEILERYRVAAYDENKKRGLLRHINARESRASGDILVTLVINAGKVPAFLYEAAREIVLGHEAIKGVVANLNQAAGNKILGDKTELLAGTDFIEETLKTERADFPQKLRDGLKFRLSSTSFFQVNSDQATRLLEFVYEAVRSGDGKVPLVIDAYAGVGAISLWVQGAAEKVIAVEEHDVAVEDGRLNAQLNGIDNVEFVHATVEAAFPEMAESGLRPDVVILDPPRKGADPSVLNQTMALSPQRIVYVSCNPATLARDLKILESGDKEGEKRSDIGYKTIQIQPVDLFPQTYHVESVAILEKV